MVKFMIYIGLFLLVLVCVLGLNKIQAQVYCPVEKVQLAIISKARPNMGPLQKEFLQKAIYAAALKNKLPPEIVTAKINVESDFWPHKVGSKGEKGISQIMPMWQKGIDPFETEANINKGAEILAAELAATNGDMYRALRRYNGGGPNGEKIESTKAYADKIQAIAYRAEKIACGT